MVEKAIAGTPAAVEATARFTGWLALPLKERSSGRLDPAGSVAGNCAFTCTSPANPGVRPQNVVCTAAPPIVIVGEVVHVVSGDAPAAAPVAGALLNGPTPVR